MESFFAWLPLIVIFGLLIVLAAYQMRSYGKHVDRVQTINDEILAINREMIAELREIKEILRDRK